MSNALSGLDLESPSLLDTVPKDLDANLKYRRALWRLGNEDRVVRRHVIEACSKDLLFFTNAFVWTFDPRRSDYPAIPLVTFEAQDNALREIEAAIGNYDLFTDKSRCVGATWCSLVPIWHRFRFKDLQSFLLVSRNKDYVEKKGNPKALFTKLDFLIRYLPPWLRTPINRDTRTDSHLLNPYNRSVIDGESTTGDLAAGDRRTCIFLDEFSRFELADGYRALESTQNSSFSRLFNGTPEGMGNAHYKVRQSSIRKFSLHWSQWPVNAVGMYTSRGDKLILLDVKYWRKRIPVEQIKAEPILVVEGRYGYTGTGRECERPELCEYPFILDGKLRSLYYDNEWNRAPLKSIIASQLDIDYLGAGSPVADPAEIAKAIKDYARDPVAIGELNYDSVTCCPLGFKSNIRGRLLLWCPLDIHGRPPSDLKCVVGADIAVGTGASNSCAVVWAAKTGEKVAEYANPTIGPYRFAAFCVALARWFGAHLIWEANGCGREFGQRVYDTGFRDFYYRKVETKPNKPETDFAGWWSTTDTKRSLIIEYAEATFSGACVNRSKRAIEELGQYQYGEGNSVFHTAAESSLDPTGARDAHGDLVIADGCAYLMLKEWGRAEKAKSKPPMPENCFLARRMASKREKLEAAVW